MLQRLFLVLSLLTLPALTLALGAKTEEGTEVLFQGMPLFPTQGGPGAKWANLGGSGAMLVGGVGGLLVGQRWNIGVASYSLSSEVLVERAGLQRDIGLSYGGIAVGPSFFPRRLFYFNVETLFAWGRAWGVTRQAGGQRTTADFMVVEPGFSWMLNFTREVRLSTTLSWRFIAGADTAATVGMGLEGPALGFTLLYGRL